MPEEEVELYDYLKVIGKRKWLIIIGTLVCVLAAGLVSLRLSKVYETTLDIRIGKVWGTFLEDPHLVSETIKSKSFLAKVINKLNLELSSHGLKGTVKASIIKDNLIRLTVEADSPAKTVKIIDAMANLILENHRDKYDKAMAFYYQYEEDLTSQIAKVESRVTEMETTLFRLQKNPQTNAPAVILLQAQLEQKETQLISFIRELRDVRVKNYSEMNSEMTRVENPPIPPINPVAPKKRQIVLIALVLGAIASLFMAFSLEYLEKMSRK